MKTVKVNFFLKNYTTYHLAFLMLLFNSYLGAQGEVFIGHKIFHLGGNLIAKYVQLPEGDGSNLRLESISDGTPLLDIPVDSNDIRDMALADIDNDAQDELVVLTRLSILVFEKDDRGFIDRPVAEIELYGSNRSGDISVVLPKISWTYYEPAYVSPEDRSGGRIAIGDVDNDGNNEVVVTKTLLYNTDPQTPFKEFYSAIDILEWIDGTLIVVDTYTQLFGDGKEGVFIMDLDSDDKNELLVASWVHFTILEHVEDPENYPSDEGGGLYRQRGSVTGRYQPKGVMVLAINKSQDWGQRTFITEIEGEKVLARAVLMLTSSPVEEIGKLRFFYLDPKVTQVFKSGSMKGTSPPKVPYLYADDLEQPFLPIQLPVEKKNGRTVAELESLSSGDLDGDGKIEIIANMRDGAQIHKIEK